MKKRIFMLALVVGVLLSVCASAWAADGQYTMYSSEAEYKTIYKITARQGLSFNIRLRAKYTSGQGVSADAIQFVITETPDAIFSGDLVVTPVSASLPTDGSYVVAAVLSGTLSESIASGTTGTVKVKAKLMYENNDATTTDSNAVTSKDATIEFTAIDGTETRNSDFPELEDDTTWGLNDMFDTDEEDKADPDSDFYDGIDPIFYSNPGDNSTAKAKAKLTTTKISDFTAGTAGTATITVTGPVTEVDVYIAAKDAAKLWPDSVDKTGDNIRLNKENIKLYKIPFRITASDDSGNLSKLTGATDSAGKKKDKEAAKKMTTKFTLAFNGADVAYKGFPITFAVKNDEMSKAAAKALKINVKPYDVTPGVYRYEPTEFTDTVSIDLNSGDIIGVSADGVITSTDTGSGQLHSLTDNYDSTYSTFTFSKMTSGDAYRYMSGDQVVASGDTATNVQYTYTYKKNAPVLYDKSKKPNWDIAVPLNKAEGEEGLGDVEATEDPTEFVVSGEHIAPYIITVKPTLDKIKNGVSYTINQPEYDNLGRVTTEGSVVIGGTITETTKETKTAVTITATNPSTKKKASVKINVIGKLPAKFDKSKFVDAEDAADQDEDYMKTVMNVKAVEAGKVPSATFKAKGSKTISYVIANVSNAQADELAAVGLSLDAKKGKIIALTTKDKVVPTVDDDGNYSPLDLVVQATNGITYEGEDGADLARALIGVTGAKPSLNEKAVTFAAKDTTVAASGDYIVGAFKTFKLNAGQLKPAKPTDTAANVKVALADDSDTTLSDLGLELITWESLDTVVSKEMEITELNAVIFESGDALSADFTLISTDGTTDITNAGYTKTNDDGDLIFASEDLGEYWNPFETDDDEELKVTVKYGSEESTGDENYRNYGIIRVVTPSKMVETKKAKVNVVLENIGAEGKGAVTVTISDTNSSSKTTSARKTVAVDATKAKTGSAGTAGSKNATALPDGAKAESEAEEAAEEAAVTVGAPRTFADVTEAQKAFLAEKGYKVIAVLPEISATAEGQQDFEVELDEDAPEGEKMVYVPFPKDVEETEDDRIADFYDEAGAAIEEVPEGKNIVVAPWLRADVVYQPVIAVEAAAE